VTPASDPAQPRPARVKQPRINLGIAGLSRGFMFTLPTLQAEPRLRVTACADPLPEARARFQQDFPGSAAHAEFAALCADPRVDAIYIATPHQFHATQAIAAARAGKHVLVEKPMATSLACAQAMVEAARAAGTALVVGHSHSFDAPYRAARHLIASGSLGRLRMITALNFTDFIMRPRRAEELDTTEGGGVVFSQAAHQLDIIRLLGGGMLRDIRATTMPARGTEGGYCAHITFTDGGVATATYDGLAHWDSNAWQDGIGEMGVPAMPFDAAAIRAALAVPDEAALKRARGYGAGAALPAPAAHHAHFGPVLVSCDDAVLRPGPAGLHIHDAAGTRLHAVPLRGRAEIFDELLDAIAGRPVTHHGAWGLATLEACLAILHSEGETITLQHQVPCP